MNENISIFNTKIDPIILFKNWFEEASQKEINDPNAMNLSTISKDFKPSSRMVLLKSFDERGFVFYSNINSKKGVSIVANKNVALTFHWKSLLRQIRIEGSVERVTDKEADDYFNSRSENSRIGAWASDQSSELADREILMDNFKFYKKKFKNKTITRPSYWTGYRVEPKLIEFWQDIPHRLHDRLEYKKINKEWHATRLFP